MVPQCFSPLLEPELSGHFIHLVNILHENKNYVAKRMQLI